MDGPGRSRPTGRDWVSERLNVDAKSLNVDARSLNAVGWGAADLNGAAVKK